jgi:hypothetical protein
MNTASYVRDFIFPAAFSFLPQEMNTRPARAMLMAIAFQESGFANRAQLNNGPARGWWQFEPSGVVGVMDHRTSSSYIKEVLRGLGYSTMSIAASHEAVEHNDALACCYARLLLWTHPKPLPTDTQAGWDYYNFLWRPGQPRRDDWNANWSLGWSYEDAR